MTKKTYKIRSKVWRYPGMAGWYFLSVPKKESAAIKKAFGAGARGWGSLPVRATLGKTNWESSIFPERMSGTYLLPLNAKVRKAERVGDSDAVTFTIALGRR